LGIMAEMLKTAKVNSERMLKASKKGFLTATDLVYYLVTKGESFRNAHEIVGKIIAFCEECNMQLEYMALPDLKKYSERFTYDVTRILSAESSVKAKDVHGGTAPSRVKEAIKRARANFLHD